MFGWLQLEFEERERERRRKEAADCEKRIKVGLLGVSFVATDWHVTVR